MKWGTIRFGDLYSTESRNGLTKPSKIRGSGYKMINMGELFANDRIYDIPMELAPLKDTEKINAKIEIGDLLFARQSLVLEGAGKCSIVMEVSPLTMFESHLIRVRLDRKRALPMFYYYYFKSPLSPMASIVSQCAQAGIRGSDLQELNVIFPPLYIQNKIAQILSYYDDLIENNQKQIKLLEEAAQRLYKKWFIDLRFPGHETTPIVDGVPEGWRKGKISDFVPTSSGGTPSRTHSEYYSDGTNLWVKTQELNDGFIFDTEEKITDDAIRNSSAKIIPQGSILMAMYGATIGKIGIAATELTCNQACCVFNLSKIKYATSYLYCWLKDNREFFISQGKGAAQPNLSQAMIKNFDVLIPTADILTTFSQVTDTLLELSAKLHLQNRGLIESRDRLLPKLMSGEIEV